MDLDALKSRLELEAGSLREKIAVAQHRLAEIETFLKLAKKFAGKSDAPTSWDDLMHAAIGPQPTAAQRDRIVAAAEKILSDGRRRSTRELLVELSRYGISPGGDNPLQNLSTYLSREKERFSSDVRRGGWAVKWAATRVANSENVALASAHASGSTWTTTAPATSGSAWTTTATATGATIVTANTGPVTTFRHGLCEPGDSHEARLADMQAYHLGLCHDIGDGEPDLPGSHLDFPRCSNRSDEDP